MKLARSRSAARWFWPQSRKHQLRRSGPYSTQAKTKRGTSNQGKSNTPVSVEVADFSFPELFRHLRNGKSASETPKSSSPSTAALNGRALPVADQDNYSSDTRNQGNANTLISVEVADNSFPELFGHLSNEKSASDTPKSSPPSTAALNGRALPVADQHDYSPETFSSGSIQDGLKLYAIRGPVLRYIADKHKGRRLKSISLTHLSSPLPETVSTIKAVDKESAVASYSWGNVSMFSPKLFFPGLCRDVYTLRLPRIDTIAKDELLPLDKFDYTDLNRRMLGDQHMELILRAACKEKFPLPTSGNSIIADADALGLLFLFVKDAVDGKKPADRAKSQQEFYIDLARIDNKVFISAITVLPEKKADRDSFEKCRMITNNAIRVALMDRMYYNRFEIATYKFMNKQQLVVRYPVELLVHSDVKPSAVAFMTTNTDKRGTTDPNQQQQQQQQLPVALQRRKGYRRLPFEPHPDYKGTLSNLDPYRIQPYDGTWSDRLQYELFFSRLYRGYHVEAGRDFTDSIALLWRPATTGRAEWLQDFERTEFSNLHKFSNLLDQLGALPHGQYILEARDNNLNIHFKNRNMSKPLIDAVSGL